MKYCRNKTDIPAGDHYAIIEFVTVHIEGDERSRQCPGHGYPAHTEYYSQYIAFEKRDEWEREVKKRVAQDKKDYVALRVAPAKIRVEVMVDIE